jgi:beta-N-acetylhexosaminidase
MINKRKSFITGLKGTKLNEKEIYFLKKYKPWGVILFSRNIKSINQTYKLTSQIKKIFKDENYPILIDEEGGKVSRLNKLIDNSIFSAEFFSNLYIKDKKKFYTYYNVYVKQICYLLNLLGININTVPVLDVKRRITNKVIGNRSFSSNPFVVSKLGKICIKKYHENRIGTVIKHIPGHGLSKVDSHNKLPIIKESINLLNKTDFLPFKKQNSFLAMTAHIVYSSIDSKNTATHSQKVINIIRKKIGFKNIIMSDDISMKSLKYSITKNTTQAFNSGCDLVLHCNGKYKEMLIVAKNSPLLSTFIIKKTSQLLNIIR